jgi:hypothetical protein
MGFSKAMGREVQRAGGVAAQLPMYWNSDILCTIE